MTPPFVSLLLAGYGQMGKALLEGWRTNGVLPRELFIIEPDVQKGKSAAEHYGARCFENTAALPAEMLPECVIFAVKPQSLEALLPYYQKLLTPSSLVLSVVAGKTLSWFDSLLGPFPLVRTMPNTPALVGKGMTVLVANGHATEAHRRKAEMLMQAVGRVEWVEDEGLMDAVTAVSGSGPAYMFLMLETFTEAGVKAGLPEPLARTLALETLRGSGELAATAPNSFAQLRRNVTSPGGTTEAALSVLMGKPGLAELMEQAVAKAAARSRELAS